MLTGFIKYYFILVGIVFLYFTVVEYKKNAIFISSLISAKAKVIDLGRKKYSDSAFVYRPIFEFEATDGKKYTFESIFENNSPTYRLGELVDILYLESNPNEAKVDGFFSLYSNEITNFSLASFIITVGSGLILYSYWPIRKRKILIAKGDSRITKIQKVEVYDSLRDNGKHPYIIYSNWSNPVTNELLEFKSEHIWFDPSKFITKDTIVVFFDKNNPMKYWMDIRFLPKKPWEFSDLF